MTDEARDDGIGGGWDPALTLEQRSKLAVIDIREFLSEGLAAARDGEDETAAQAMGGTLAAVNMLIGGVVASAITEMALRDERINDLQRQLDLLVRIYSVRLDHPRPTWKQRLAWKLQDKLAAYTGR